MKLVAETTVEDELETLGVGVTELDEAELECFDFDIIVVLVDDDDEERGVGETGSNA